MPRTLLAHSSAPDIQEFLALFEERGHQVTERALGDLAWNSRDEERFDLVVVWTNDEQAGPHDLIAHIVDARSGHLPVVFARTDALRLPGAISAGADDFLLEEVSRGVLCARISLAERRVAEAQARAAADAALEESHAHLVALIENVDRYVLFCDKQGAPIFYNSRYAEVMKEVLGLEMKPGARPHALLPDPETWEAYHQRVLSGERFRADYVLTGPSDQEILLEVSYNPVIVDGEIVGFSEITQDVTPQRSAAEQLRQAREDLELKVEARTAELAASNRALHEEIRVRRDAEAALRESEERYRMVYETAPLAMVLWDEEHRILGWNRHAEKLFGWTEAEVLGRDFFEFGVPEDARDQMREEINGVFEGKASGYSVNENLTRTGERILCEWTSAVIHGRNEHATAVLSLGVDITERGRLEERLRRSEKLEAIGQLAGGIAHDFNNQLVGVLGYAELLRRSLTDPGQRSWADGILRSARRSSDLVSQLLAFARKGTFRQVPVDLHAVIDDVAALLARSIDKQVVIERLLCDEEAITLGDPTLLQNALLNLALNARDAMPDGGVLTFATGIRTLTRSRPGDTLVDLGAGRYVEVEVRDTGVGMDAQTRAHIFEPFFTTKESGTGMGLAAVYGTVRQHNGAIAVQTEPGVGTTFQLLLPATELQPDDTTDPRVVGPVGQQLHLMVVDDEDGVRNLLVEMLQVLGHRATAFADGAQAIEWYRERHGEVDLVLFDLVMPEIGGRELFSALKQIDPQVRGLLSSGYAVDDRSKEIFELGARGYLRKPFDLARLSQAITDAL